MTKMWNAGHCSVFERQFLLYPDINEVNEALKVSKTRLKQESTALVYDLTVCFFVTKNETLQDSILCFVTPPH